MIYARHGMYHTLTLLEINDLCSDMNTSRTIEMELHRLAWILQNVNEKIVAYIRSDRSWHKHNFSERQELVMICVMQGCIIR